MLDYGIKAAGHHSVKWDGRNKKGLNVTSGIYVYRIEMRTENGGQRPFVAIKKMILMK
jgi:flagellar hook assembly protein FlgD